MYFFYYSVVIRYMYGTSTIPMNTSMYFPSRSRKKKLMWQLGTLVGAPVGIALLAGISVPAMIIGIPVWVSRKLHARFSQSTRCRRNTIIAGGVVASVVVSPVLAGLAVSIGVPILLAYVYGVVPISLCRSEGCGVSTSGAGVKIDVDEEEMPYTRMVSGGGGGSGGGVDALSTHGGSQIGNPSIGEVSLGASLSLGSACHLEDKVASSASNAAMANMMMMGGVGGDSRDEGLECDRESASVTAIAGTSRTVSLASSYVGGGGGVGGSCFAGYQVCRETASHASGGSHHHLRLEVGADVHGTTGAANMMVVAGAMAVTAGAGGGVNAMSSSASTTSATRKKFSLSSERLEGR